MLYNLYMKLWATLHTDKQITASCRCSSSEQDAAEAIAECLGEACKTLDISEPVWLKKHARELVAFRRTKFFAHDFIDSVNFDYMEIEYTLDD